MLSTMIQKSVSSLVIVPKEAGLTRRAELVVGDDGSSDLSDRLRDLDRRRGLQRIGTLLRTRCGDRKQSCE